MNESAFCWASIKPAVTRPAAAAAGGRSPSPPPRKEKLTGSLMIKTFRQMLEVMTPRERRGFYLQVVLLFVVGMFETAGVAL